MASPLLCIDHPVVAVRDLQLAFRRFDALGFTVPPMGNHLEWGTGNLCIMFGLDYLELRGIVDPARYTHHLDAFLEEREGLMGVAFGTDDAEAVQRKLHLVGGVPPQVLTLTRRFSLPHEERFPKFRIVYFEEGLAPGLMTTVACQHLTPELIRRADWLVHRNSTIGVKSLTSVVPDPISVVSRYKALLGDEAVHSRNGSVEVSLSTGANVEFLSPRQAEATGKALPGVKPPYLSSVTLDVGDIGRAASVLEESGCEYIRVSAQKILIGCNEAFGMNLFLEQVAHPASHDVAR